MGSVRKVSSLSTLLLAKTGPACKQKPSTALPVSGLSSQLKSKSQENEQTKISQIIETETSPIVQTCSKSESEHTMQLNRLVKAEGDLKVRTDIATQPTDTCLETDSCLATGGIPPFGPVQKMKSLLANGRNIACHSVVAFSKLNAQQVRYYSDRVPSAEKCIPREKCLNNLPKPCIKAVGPSQPCRIPTQKKWLIPSTKMCLPCCCMIDNPIKCKTQDIRLNNCPRKTYRIPAYSECSKLYGKVSNVRECCYKRRLCYAREIAEREIIPLITIRKRQAMALGFHAKTPEEPWGS